MQEIRVKVSSELKRDIDALARMKGKNMSSIVRDALKLYVQKEHYEKAEDILNIEDRVGIAVVTELYPQLEEIKSRLDMIMDAVHTQSSQAEKSPEKEESEVDFPKIPGLRYKVDGKNVIYKALFLGMCLTMEE